MEFFFPGKQYTPSDFNEKKVTGGTFLTLGSFGNFSLGSTSEASNGTATYRLTLSPRHGTDIFFVSAGNFFRLHTLPKRGKSLLAGNPDQTHYKDLIGNKEISFYRLRNRSYHNYCHQLFAYLQWHYLSTDFWNSYCHPEISFHKTFHLWHYACSHFSFFCLLTVLFLPAKT